MVPKQLLVIDKNALRGKSARALQKRASLGNFDLLIIDEILAEIGRNGDFIAHFQKDFHDWSEIPGCLWVANDKSALMNDEFASGRPSAIVDTATTDIFRDCLRQLPSGGSATLTRSAARIDEALKRRRLPGGSLNAETWLGIMHDLVKALSPRAKSQSEWFSRIKKEVCGGGPLKLVGEAALDPVLVHDTGCLDALIRSGCLPQVAEKLLNQPSFTNLHYGALLAYALVFLAQGQQLGAEIDEEKFLNHRLDMGYVAYALRCGGLATNDKLLQRVEAGLRDARDERWGKYHCNNLTSAHGQPAMPTGGDSTERRQGRHSQV